MESTMATLNELNEKYKRNYGLSNQDTETMINAVNELFLKSMSWDDGFNFIMNCPPEVGMQAYINFYSTLDRGEQKQFNTLFVKNSQFAKNTQNKAVYRGTALVGRLIEQKCTSGDIVYILKHVCKLAFSNIKREISIQNIRYVQKEIIVKCNKHLLDIKLSMFNLTDRDFNFIQRVLIKSAFTPSEKLEITAMSQYVILKWLLESGKKVSFESIEENMVHDALKKWPEEMKNVLNQDTALQAICSGFINSQNSKYTDESTEGKIIEENKILIEDSIVKETKQDPMTEKVNNKDIIIQKSMEETENIKDMLTKITTFIDNAEEQVDAKIKELREITLDLNVTRVKLAQEEEKVKTYSQRLGVLEQNIDSLNREIENLKLCLRIKDEEIEKLKKSENEYRDNLQLMHGVRKREDSSFLTEFKNKLSSKLKYEYMDFKEIESVEMTVDIGENLRIQMKNIFNELEKQRINLE